MTAISPCRLLPSMRRATCTAPLPGASDRRAGAQCSNSRRLLAPHGKRHSCMSLQAAVLTELFPVPAWFLILPAIFGAPQPVAAHLFLEPFSSFPRVRAVRGPSLSSVLTTQTVTSPPPAYSSTLAALC